MDPIDINFLQNFHRQPPPPFAVCTNLPSNFFVAAPLEKVEFLWRDWSPIIRRSGDQFPNWSEGRWKLRRSCIVRLRWSSSTASVRFLRQKPLVSPPLFPSSPLLLPQLQEAEQSKSLTAAEKTLCVARFTIPPLIYFFKKHRKIVNHHT